MTSYGAGLLQRYRRVEFQSLGNPSLLACLLERNKDRPAPTIKCFRVFVVAHGTLSVSISAFVKARKVHASITPDASNNCSVQLAITTAVLNDPANTGALNHSPTSAVRRSLLPFTTLKRSLRI